MASIDKLPTGKYRARWREFPNGPQKYRTFARKIDAGRFLTEIAHGLQRGTYVDPRAGETTLAEYTPDFLARRSHRGATSERTERELRLHILPAFGGWPLLAIKRANIERWAAGLPLAPSSVATVTQTLSSILSGAVEDGRLPNNPATKAQLPRINRPPLVPLTVDEVVKFVRGFPAHVRGAAALAAGTGLRQGEAFGLSLDRVNFLRRELRVDRQLWTPDKGSAVLVAPKSQRSYRTIALSDTTVDALAAHLAQFGPGDDDLIFHQPSGRPILRGVLNAYVRKAASSAGVEGRTWHDFRHHHASLLLSEGISPALVAERLGHDLKTLLRTYSHVIRSDDDRVRAVLDGAFTDRAESFLSPSEGQA